MPRRKPAGWPKMMRGKRIKGGLTAYYWDIPSWAKKAGCTLRSAALGTDYGVAKQRCDELMNPQFDAWRSPGEFGHVVGRPTPGSFDWMVSLYKSTPKFTRLPAVSRESYDRMLSMVSTYKLKDGRLFGASSLRSITPGVADRLADKLSQKSGGGQRVRTAVLAMTVCKRAWNVAYRENSQIVPTDNPFAKMGLKYKAKPTRPVSHEELVRFVEAADRCGEASIGTAAMLAYYWLQRQVDILGRLTWGDYRPANAPNTVRIFHPKTGQRVDHPLLDVDGTLLWPEMTDRLDRAKQLGSLIVMRDKPDRGRKIHLPWQRRYFALRVAEIREFAGIDPEAKFMGLRHGGNTEGADANLTDAQLRALSGHLSPSMTALYAKATMNQRREGARKRREVRTKRGGLSE